MEQDYPGSAVLLTEVHFWSADLVDLMEKCANVAVMAKTVVVSTARRRDEGARKVVNPADYRTLGAKPPTKAERDSLRVLLENRARLA